MRRIMLSLLGLITFGHLSMAEPTLADTAAAQYRFEAPEQLVKVMPGNRAGTVEIRLVKVATGQPVAGATIVASALRMPMNYAGTMNASASFIANQSSDTYRFALRAPMTGNWLLDLTAKLPGEPDAIRGTVALYIELERPRRGVGNSGGSEIRDDDPRWGEEP